MRCHPQEVWQRLPDPDRLETVFTTTESSLNQTGQTRVQDAPTLVVNRWSRYGKRRLYVNTVDDQQVGWVDLDSGERVLSMPELADAFGAAVDGIVGGRSEPYSPRRMVDAPDFASQPRRAVAAPPSHPVVGSSGTERHPGVRRDDEGGESRRVIAAPPSPAVVGSSGTERDPGVRRDDNGGESRRADTAPGLLRDDSGQESRPASARSGLRRDGTAGQSQPTPEEPWTDLAANVPGQAARARAQQELAELRERKGAFLTFLARGLDAKTDERSWRVGADGEESVGARLEKLRTDGWQLLHSVPVGKRDSDIDHVLIGPGGVFTLNTKTHPKANIWVGRTTVMVNGHKQPYLRNSRFEADRAAKLLSHAVGRTVDVTPALVFLTDTFLPNVTIKDRPEDVLILDRLDIPRYFRRRPAVLTPSEVEQLFDTARRSTTWR